MKLFIAGSLSLLVLLQYQTWTEKKEISGPYTARVIKVTDGDTIRAYVRIWLGQQLEVGVRIKDIDTPEKKGKCLEESAKAEEATKFLSAWVRPGSLILLTNIKDDKYHGRIVADVSYSGNSVSVRMIGEGLALPYTGEGPKPDWCKILKNSP